METFCSFKEYYFVLKIESRHHGIDWEHDEYFDYFDKYEKKEPSDYEEEDFFIDIYQFSKKIPMINFGSNVFSIPCLKKINEYIDWNVYIVYHFHDSYVDVFKHFFNFDDANKYYQKMLEEQKQEVEEWNKQLEVSEEGRLLIDKKYNGSTLCYYMSPKIIIRKKDCFPFQSTVYEEVPEKRKWHGFKCKYKGHSYKVEYPDKGCRWVFTEFNIDL